MPIITFPRPTRRSPLLLSLMMLCLAGAPLAASTAAAQTGSEAKKSAAAKAAKASKLAKAAKAKAAKAKADAEAQAEYVNFADWKEVSAFVDEIVSKHGFDRAALLDLMAQVKYVETTIQLIKPGPPGKPKNWQAYHDRFIEPVRIAAGVQFWRDNEAALARAEQTYGVPADIIVGIIGVETVYGQNTGRFRVLDALTTLAFAYPEAPTRDARMAFFRGELESALVYARQDGIDPLSLLGSYAGAVGLPQFMPSSILNFGVDFDGDGKIDLRGSATDAIGSVAHFLVEHGWQRDLAGAAAYPASVSPSRAWEPFIGQGLEAKFRMDELAAAGVSAGLPLPADMKFGLVDLQNGADPTEYWLATANFFAITQYNRSYFYAMSVIDLGQAVRSARGNAPL